MPEKSLRNRLNLLLLLFPLLYFLPFINRGLPINDEGYMVHVSERIAIGEMPYKDFFLQYSPGIFLFLGLIYRLFGVSIYYDRVLALLLYLLNIYFVLLITDKLAVRSFWVKFSQLLIMTLFGYPLFNFAMPVQALVPLTGLAILLYLLWTESGFRPKYLICLGLVVALAIFIKQNIGISLFIVSSSVIWFSEGKGFIFRLKKLAPFLFVVIVPTILWLVYYFVFVSNIQTLVAVLDFNRRYLSIYPFRYFDPEILMGVTDPVIILLFYFPVFILISAVISLIKSGKNIPLHIAVIISFCCWLTNMFPTNDYLHLSPYYGQLLALYFLLILKQNSKHLGKILTIYTVLAFNILVFTFLGKYFTFYKPYWAQTSVINNPIAKNIYVESEIAIAIQKLGGFIRSNSLQNKPVLVYPSDTLLYPLLGIKNPTPYPILYPGYLTDIEENNVISNLRSTGLRYVIISKDSDFNKPLSQWIVSQKQIADYGLYRIYQVTD